MSKIKVYIETKTIFIEKMVTKKLISLNVKDFIFYKYIYEMYISFVKNSIKKNLIFLLEMKISQFLV